jgi:hypothetical protein
VRARKALGPVGEFGAHPGARVEQPDVRQCREAFAQQPRERANLVHLPLTRLARGHADERHEDGDQGACQG